MTLASRLRCTRTRAGAAAACGALLAAGGAAAGTYTVRPGDTLGAIANRHGVLLSDLAASNGIANRDLIRIGQRLVIPAPGEHPTGPATHLVRRGETLARISATYGIPAATIAAANGIVGGRIYAGQRLRLAPVAAPDGHILRGPDPAASTVHVVRRGETLGAIAARYGVTTRALAAANGIADPNRIRIGARLTVGRGWRCPVAGPVRFVNDWGFPRAGGRAHLGTDLFAARGTKVVAPVAGRVTQVTGTVGGRQFTLHGDDGFVYIGSHLDSFGASGRVGPGAVLGTVGTTGNAAGGPPHLHFEIHPRGLAAVNPFPTVAAACRG